MKFWILITQEGDRLYFSDKMLMINFISLAFKVKCDTIDVGIHATAWGAPFWIVEKMMIGGGIE